MEIRSILDEKEKQALARRVLEALPAWFGIPESREEYIRESASMPLWAADDVGFIAMKVTSPYTAEVYVMGVMQPFHRCGVGRMLMQALEAHARQTGYEYLQVKTVAAGCYPEYDRTRMFYEACGFRALEVFPTLWDEQNPCLIMVKAL